MNKTIFWKKVKSRRDAVFLWWLAWIPAEILFTIAYRKIFRREPSTSVMWAALLAWGCFSFVLTHRLVTLPCPRCGQYAFHHIFFLMRHAKCRNCGFRLAST